MLKRHLMLVVFGIGIWFTGTGFYLPSTPPAAEPQPEEDRTIRVAVKEIEPFVIKEKDRLTGFSIDLWKELALLTGLSYEFVEVSTVDEQLSAVLEGDAEVAVAAISMTPEREAVLDFTYPYFLAGLQIMTTGKTQSTFASLLAFLGSSRFLLGLAALFVIMIIISHITWLVERSKNPDFPRSYVKGIWEGLWWAAATMTTVGYGDKTVKDKWGRLIGIFWMFSGLFIIANFTAYVTAEVTVKQLKASISGFEDLPGKKVVTLTGTTSAEYLQELGIPFRSLQTIEEAYTLLENEQADAMVYDAPVLQYYVASASDSSLQVVGSPVQFEYYGIALKTDSPYREPLNRAMLELRMNGTYDELITKWHLSELRQ